MVVLRFFFWDQKGAWLGSSLNGMEVPRWAFPILNNAGLALEFKEILGWSLGWSLGWACEIVSPDCGQVCFEKDLQIAGRSLYQAEGSCWSLQKRLLGSHW